MKARPLLSFTVWWIAGSAAACLFSGARLLLAGAGCLLLITVWALSRKCGWKYAAALGIALLVSALYWEWNEGRNLSELPELLSAQPSAAELNEMLVRAEGVIVSAVERDGDRVDFTLELSGIASVSDGGQSEATAAGCALRPVHGELAAVQVKLQAESEIAVTAGWQRGDRVAITGELAQPSEARNFGGFDYRAYLHTQRIHWLLKVTGAETVRAEAPSSLSPVLLLRWNDAARAALGAELDQLFQPIHAGYMKGLVIGIQDELDPETFRQFSQLGLTHILAISGMHVAVYVGVLLFILRRLRLSRETALTVVFLLVPLYVLLSGAGPSVVRAGLMSMTALLAARLGLLKDGMNILALAALLMLICSPYLLLSVSFQLSFLVTAGLMVYVPLAAPLLSRLPKWLAGSLNVTLVAQLVSFPLTIYYFNQFSLLSFAANLVLVPFITFLVLPLGTGALLLARLWPAAAHRAAQAAELLNNATFKLVEWINGYSGGVLIWRSPSLLWIGAYYLLLYGMLYALKCRADARKVPQYMEDETRPLAELATGAGTLTGSGGHFGGKLQPGGKQLAAMGCVAALALLLYLGYRPFSLGGAGQISYLDVGQGDSILITTPAGAHILVDGGGTLNFGRKEEWRIRRDPFEVGAKTLLPLLKARGIHRLDAVILTHGDQDHAGGLQAVLEGMPVSALLFNGTLADSEAYGELMRTALRKEVRLYAVHQGMTLSPDGGTKLHFLWPETPTAGSSSDAGVPLIEEQNHDSVAFRLEMNGYSFLFTGDMDKAAETEIVEAAELAGISAANSVEVLKAAHHGSKTSTGAGWLQFWQPKTAVISAGVNNLYGHPNSEVLERLAAAGIRVFRTDLHGEIQIRVEEEGIRLRHKLGNSGGK
ncbi:ComEC/Rec2 family competence protein [Paenibacillus tengchongensis]|uniref:ComEC/Rec2 family competence protein n=1 Tax=Paenibacillus tengchongensis TaxID=2608684 RepID=UPI00124C5FAD|nr:ComEC/Rec2 family competence protein [Paenibacillus tengchongensis]